MSLLETLNGVVPLAGRAALLTADRNFLRIPVADPATVKSGVLARHTGAPVVDATAPPRVYAILGPGATFAGLADVLLPLYTQAAAPPGSPAAPTADQLAKAVVSYAKDQLSAGDWKNHRVGVTFPLPIEIDASGAWIVNADDVRNLAVAFPAGWRPRLTTAPAPLAVPDPFQLAGVATALSTAKVTAAAVGADLWEKSLLNASDSALLVLAVLRLRADAPAVALASLSAATPGQLGVLATIKAGNAILRTLNRLLTGATGVDPAALAAARSKVATALGKGTPVVPRELPETPDQLTERRRPARPPATGDPADGLHRLVLGHDVLAGRTGRTAAGAGRFVGPSYAGRLVLAQTLKSDAPALNPPPVDARMGGLLHLLDLGEPHQGLLDAVRAQDAKLLTVGIGNWSATDPAGLPLVLFEFKQAAPDEFDLYFALHGLDARRDPAAAGQAQLLSLAPDGTPTVLTPATAQAFLGGTTTGNTVTFAPEWAARFRFAALTSAAFRRVQIQRAAAQLGTTAAPERIAAASFGPFAPEHYQLTFDAAAGLVLGPQLTKAMDGDPALGTHGVLGQAHIDHPQLRSWNTLAAAVIDLTGATPVYAGYNEDETFYVGSLDKTTTLYAAQELRHRVQQVVKATAGLNTAVAHWERPVLAALREVWFPQIAKGFPGLDTGPNRMPKLEKILDFALGGAITLNRTHGTAANVATAGEFGNLPANSGIFWPLTSTIAWSNNTSAAQTIGMLGFPYINGALREGGFFNTTSKRGMWISGNYSGDAWAGRDFRELSARGERHYKKTTNFAGSARMVAHLLALAATNGLFDRDAALCTEFLTIMDKPPADPALGPGTVSFLADTLTGLGRAVTSPTPSKIGIGDAAPANHAELNGIHDCAVITRVAGGRTQKFVAVVLGGYANFHLNADPESGLFDGFVKALDDLIAARP